MAVHKGQIPGLYSSDKNVDWSSDDIKQENQNDANNSINMDTSQSQGSDAALSEMRMEKDNLGLNFVHSHRLLDAEISKAQRGCSSYSNSDSNNKQVQKIYVNLQDQKQHNLVGRLLGPKGVTLKRIQAETQTKISILGRGSMRDKKKEEELANASEAGFEHLKDPLHVLIEALPPYSNVKLAAAVAEVRKMLIPLEPGAHDLVVAKFVDPLAAGRQGGISNMAGYHREGLLPPPPVNDGYGTPGRTGGARGGHGASRGGARGALARLGTPRGRGRGSASTTGRGRGSPSMARGGTGGRGASRGAPGSRGGAGERGARMRSQGGRGGGGGGGYDDGYSNRESSYSSGRGDGVGGGPIRPRASASAATYERMSDYKPETNVGYGSDYDRSGYGDREESSYRRSDHSSGAGADGETYYSNFSESPSRGYSRDYNHGSTSADADVGSDWKPRSRSDYRHHPYQQSSSYY